MNEQHWLKSPARCSDQGWALIVMQAESTANAHEVLDSDLEVLDGNLIDVGGLIKDRIAKEQKPMIGLVVTDFGTEFPILSIKTISVRVVKTGSYGLSRAPAERINGYSA